MKFTSLKSEQLKTYLYLRIIFPSHTHQKKLRNPSPSNDLNLCTGCGRNEPGLEIYDD